MERNGILRTWFTDHSVHLGREEQGRGSSLEGGVRLENARKSARYLRVGKYPEDGLLAGHKSLRHVRSI
jgi:hypothetical protein